MQPPLSTGDASRPHLVPFGDVFDQAALSDGVRVTSMRRCREHCVTLDGLWNFDPAKTVINKAAFDAAGFTKHTGIVVSADRLAYLLHAGQSRIQGWAQWTADDAVSALAAAPLVSFLGDTIRFVCDAKSLLGDVKSSLGDAKSSLGDAKSLLGLFQASQLCVDAYNPYPMMEAVFNQTLRWVPLSRHPTPSPPLNIR